MFASDTGTQAPSISRGHNKLVAGIVLYLTGQRPSGIDSLPPEITSGKDAVQASSKGCSLELRREMAAEWRVDLSGRIFSPFSTSVSLLRGSVWLARSSRNDGRTRRRVKGYDFGFDRRRAPQRVKLVFRRCLPPVNLLLFESI